MLATTSLSAFIRLSQAGLGCADWPQCYGSRLRAAQQETPTSATTPAADSGAVQAARVAHRALAVLVLLLVCALAARCLGSRPRLWREGALALALLGLTLGLATLGLWSVAPRVPAVSIGNLLGGLLMLALCWRLVGELASTSVKDKPSRPLLAWFGAAALGAQLALGALTSTSYAGMSCAGLSDCLRGADAAGWPWQMLNPWREPVFDAALWPNPGGAVTQLLHRGGALLVLGLLTPLGLALLRSPRRRAGILLLALLALQVTLGAAMVLSALPLPLALAHNVVAALLLATVLRQL